MSIGSFAGRQLVFFVNSLLRYWLINRLVSMHVLWYSSTFKSSTQVHLAFGVQERDGSCDQAQIRYMQKYMGQIDWTAEAHCAGTSAVELIHSVWLNRVTVTGNELEPQANLHFFFFFEIKKKISNSWRGGMRLCLDPSQEAPLNPADSKGATYGCSRYILKSSGRHVRLL